MLNAAVDASTTPDTDTDTALLIAHVQSDSDGHDIATAERVDLSATSRRAVFLVLGVVLGIIFVVVLVLGFTCTFKHCQLLHHAGQSLLALCTIFSTFSTIAVMLLLNVKIV